LFRGLAGLEGVDIVGLIQSSNLAIEAGLPVRNGVVVSGLANEEIVDRLSRVVVSLQQGPASHRLEYLRKRFLMFLGPALAAIGTLFGRKVSLGGFEAAHFKDFIWRSMFAKSLADKDFDVITSAAFRVLRWPWSMLHAVGVASAHLGRAVYPRLDTAGIRVMIVETPFPARVSAPTKMIVRYHDAIPLLMPHTIKDRGYHRAMHFRACGATRRTVPGLPASRRPPSRPALGDAGSGATRCDDPEYGLASFLFRACASKAGARGHLEPQEPPRAP